eukprot:jgi/Ulvmu1/1311/UM011_0039.1
MMAAVKQHRRTLQQETDIAKPVVVSTPQELANAISRGHSHITITSHLDLTGLPLIPNIACEKGCASPLPPIATTRSIRGDCNDAVPSSLQRLLRRTAHAKALIGLHAGQCLLVSHEDLLPLVGPRIWVDNLYLRVAAVNEPAAKRGLSSVGLLSVPRIRDDVAYAEPGRALRYVTRTTMQGDGLGSSVAIWANEDTYMEQCMFVNLGGIGANSPNGCDDCSAAVNSQNTASVHIVNSTFFDIQPGNGSRYVRVWDNSTAVLLSGCLFDDAPRPFQQRDGALIYSDNATLRVEAADGDLVAPRPLSAIPAVLVGDPPVFQSRDNAWFQATYQEVTGEAELPRAPPPPLQPPVPRLEPLGSGDANVVVLVAAIVAAALVALAAVAAVVIFIRRRRRRRAGQLHSDGGATKATTASAPTTVSLVIGAGHLASDGPSDKAGVWTGSVYTASERSSRASRPFSSSFAPYSHPRGSTAALDTSTGVGDTTFAEFETDFEGTAPAADAGVHVKLDFLQAQLNCFARDDVILERFSLLGPMHRRQGGQGVVAFARGAYDDLEYALKFFVHRSSFLAERDMYRCQALGRLLPRVYCDYDPAETPGVLCDARGRPLPPCLVMERGEGLADWSRRAKPDVFQSVAVLAHVAIRLRDLHAEGYVHRDIKPENIMLLPRENVWTVIDFGCTALAGADAPLSYTLVYAPPEVAEAAAAGAKSIVADPAMDAWALGVVAYELLTRHSAFSLLTEGRDSVVEKLRGVQELPWEGDLAEKDPTARRRLGLFREPVLGLLHRDPAQRATLADFCRTANSVFSSPTTVATTEPLAK